MTEEEKQSHLSFFREISKQVDEQDDRPGWQTLYEQMRRDIGTRPPTDPMNPFYFNMLSQVSEMIAKRTETIEKPKRAIRYLEATDAAAITPESIMAAIEG